MLGALHEKIVHSRRVRVLGEHLLQLLPREGTILDVGCGDGLLSSRIARALPGTRVAGMDVIVRPDAHIPVTAFDGRTLPLPDDAVDCVLMVDVAHHAQDPRAFLAEAQRVARRCLVIKDHTCDGVLARPLLSAMDWAGNARHGVALPNNYLREHEWRSLFAELGLRVEAWRADLHLYPEPVNRLLGRSLHFIARLAVQ